MRKYTYLTLVLFVVSFVATAQTWEISGPTAVCEGEQNVTYTVQSTGGGLPPFGSYSWKLNGVNIGNALSNSMDVDIPSSGSSHTLEVNGPSSIYASLTLTNVSGDPGTVSLSGGSCNGTSLTLSVSGNSGNLKWQRKVGGGSWSDYGLGFPDPLGDDNVSTGTTYSYRVRTNSSCATQYSNTITATLKSPTNAGSASGSHTICSGDQPSQNLTGSGQSGGSGSFSYSWEKRPSGGSWTNIGGGSSLSPGEIGTLTQDTEFRRRVTDTECGSDYSNVVTISIYDPVTPGSIGNAQTVCYNGNPSTITNSSSASGGDNISYQWQYSTNGTSGWTNQSGATGSTYNPPALTASRWYRRRATACGTNVYTNTIKITVQPDLSAGSINGAQTLCYNGNPSTLGNASSASGGDGSYSYQWQHRSPGGSWSNISGATGSTYNPPSLTSSKEYRRNVSSCSQSKSTSTVLVTIHPELTSGSIGNAQTLCYNGNASALTNTASAGGGDGSISYQWQYSTNGTSGWTNIGGETGTTFDPPALTSSRWYRRRATSCSATEYTNSIKITIHPTLNAGSIGNAQTVCYNGNPSTLTNTSSASGGDGSISYQWQYSTNGTSSWTNMSGETSATYNPPALTSDRWYRRRAISCGETEYTNVIQITVNPTLNAGSIGNAQTLCYNGNPAALTNSSSASGGNDVFSYQWQYSTNGTSGWTDLSGETSATYNPPSLTADRWYRREVYSCGETKYSNTVKITIHPELTSGSIGNAQTLCYNGNASALTNTASAGGGDGSISYQWQYSTTGIGSWTNLSGETGTTFDPPALTASRWYRRRATSCSATEYTNSVKITIHPTLSAGSIGNAQTVCYNGNPSTLTNTSSASGGDGSISYQWQYSTNGTSGWTDMSGETSATYDPPSLTSDRWYRRRATSCGETEDTNAIHVTVNPTLTAGSIGNAQTLCYEEDPSSLTSTSAAGGGDGSYSYQWQSSLNGTSGWLDLSGETGTTYNPPSLTVSKWYRREVISCGETKYSNVIEVTIQPNLLAGSISGVQTICSSTAPSLLSNTTSASGGGPGLSYQWQESATGISFTDISGANSASYQPGTLTADRWYRRGAYSTSCPAEYTSSVKVSVDPGSDGGTLSADDEVFGITSGTLSLSGENGNIEKWQYRTTGGWIDIYETDDSYDYENVDEPTYYRVQVKSGVCAAAYSNEVFINVLEEPSMDLGIQTNVRPGTGTTITTDAGHANYQWFKDDVSIQNGASNELVVTHPGLYRVTVTSTGGAVYETGNATIGSQLDEDHTYVMVYDFREAGYSETVDVYAEPMENMSITADIYDGLGRPIQKINMEGSPDGSDLVAPIEYDNLGRQQKSYLPYASTDLGKLYKPDALGTSSKQEAFYDTYNGGQYLDENAFSENKFEASPLNRVVEQGLPGNSWAIGTDHSIKMQYQVNEATEQVTKWIMNGELPQDDGDYGDGKLFKSITTDENGHQTITYTNQRKEPILVKKEIGSDWAETYYIYDERHRLRIVIQPEGVENISTYTGYTQEQDKKDFLAAWAFQYGYDGQNRQIWKQVPGAGRVYTVYDAWDRVRMTRDGNQADSSEWSFIKYDALNRPVVTGLLESSLSPSAITAAVESDTVRHEVVDSSEPNHYTQDMYPETGTVDTLTVTYYDTYDFLSQDNWDISGIDIHASLSSSYNDSPHGQVTGTKTKVSDGTWIYSTSYYDSKGRLIQTSSTNHLGSVDVVINEYNFANEIVKTTTTHDDEAHTIVREFEYDNRGRLLETWHSMDGAPAVLLAANSYNELDEVEEKQLHSTDGLSFEQYVDYGYNIRGWLTNINESDLSSTGDAVADLFGMELAYDEDLSGLAGTEQFNGNISAMRWSNYDASGSGPATRAYTYEYDKLSRLTAADHFEETTNVNRYDVSGIGYDLNGNINSLIRNGASGVGIDTLQYDYTTDYAGKKGANRLRYVQDTSQDSLGFYDGNTSGDDYTYDANGNMITDANKSITAIEYNHLNLPLKVVFSPSGGGSGEDDRIEYLYDAAGIKLQQKVYEGGSLVKTTDYVGEFIYENDTVRQVQHEEGRLVPWYLEDGITQGGFDYQYHLKDHLGNTRVTFEALEYHMVENFETGQDNGFYNLHRQVDTDANTTVGGNEVERLAEGQTGAMVFLKLKDGDEIDISVNANYTDNTSGNTFAEIAYNTLFNDFVGTPLDDNEGVTAMASEFDDAVSGGLSGKDGTSTAPRAFLNYIIFDDAMNYEHAGFIQVTAAAYGVGVHETIAINGIEAEQDGYILVYLTNENQEEVDVNFDDFTVHQQQTNVIQADDYYPYGLTFNSYQATSARVNNFKYNGKEYDENTQWYDYGARMYQADLGRWFSVDPLAENFASMTPYKYAMNNPLVFIDPDGRSEINIGYGITVDGNNTGAITHYDFTGTTPGVGNGSYNESGTLYVIATKGMSSDEVQGVVDAANKQFEEMGIGLRAKVYDESGSNLDFDMSILRSIDNYTVIGSDMSAVANKARSIDASWDIGNQLEGVDYGRSNKESNFGSVINYKGLPAAIKKNKPSITDFYGKYVIPHELGHHSKHIASKADSEGHLGDGIMREGPKVPNIINMYGFGDVLSIRNNKTYIEGMKDRYEKKFNEFWKR